MDQEKQDTILKQFEFLKLAEKLKTELRHSWTSDNSRQESVAEHVWMMTLMALLILPELEIEVDSLKVLKMIIIHDLGEALIGDIPAFEKSQRQNEKAQNERQAIEEIFGKLTNRELAEELIGLWDEFEKVETPEAQVARAIDKVEVLIQHNISDIETWNQGDYDLALYAKDYLYNFDKFIRQFKDLADNWTVKKIKKYGDLTRLKKEELDEWERKRKV